MSPSVPVALHTCLRSATKGPHHQLDHHKLLAPLVRDDLTVEQYGKALAILHSVFAPLEDGIECFLMSHPEMFDYRPRRKIPALRSDLAALAREPWDVAMRYPVPETIGELVGVLYTVEGTTKGGQHIVRCLRQFDGLPTRFFSGYGEDTETRWDEFLAFADAACPVADHPSAAVSAVSLFHAIKAHLDECG
jgi:heme oxygenase